MRNLIISIAVVSMSFGSQAQDVHFTMFHVAPTVLNPGAAGVFDGTFRANVNYKTQWGSISNPYRTFSATAEGALFKGDGRQSHMGAALSMYRDVAGTTNFGTTKVNLSLSGILLFDDNNTGSIGLTGGWGQRTISPGDLQWDAQFNGQSFDPSLPSMENYAFENTSYFDFSAGFLWTYGTAASNLASFNKTRAEAGIAYHHLARPELMSYYGELDRMYSKIVVHGSMHYASGYSRLAFRPRLSAFFQGPAREINVGLMLRYLVSEGSKFTGNVKGFAISAGGYYRVGDAFSPSVEMEIGGFTVGFAYDFNVSQLRAASKGLGGSEVYIKFQNPNPFFRFSGRPSFR